MERVYWTSDYPRRQIHRAAIKQGRNHPETIVLPRHPAVPPVIRQATINPTDNMTELYGYNVCPPAAEGQAILYRANLVLVDATTNQPVLFRMGQPEYNKVDAHKASEAEGLRRVQHLQQIGIPGNGNSRNPEKAHPVYHLGIWSQLAHAELCWSADTTQRHGAQNTRQDRADAADDVLVWAKQHMEAHISPYLRNRNFQLPENIRTQFDQRSTSFEATKANHPGAASLLGPLYSMVTPFTTFSPFNHTDRNDADFSILANFGGCCFLHLSDYRLKVHMQPGDVVVFQSNRLLHSTSADPLDAEAGQRWSVSYYMRKTVEQAAYKYNIKQAEDEMNKRGKAAQGRMDSKETGKA